MLPPTLASLAPTHVNSAMLLPQTAQNATQLVSLTSQHSLASASPNPLKTGLTAKGAWMSAPPAPIKLPALHVKQELIEILTALTYAPV